MALSLLYGKKYEKGKIGSVELDVTLREDHNYTSRVTTYPVEEGSILSDHIINEPSRLILEGIVSDTPLNVLSSFNRSTDAFQRLIQIHKKREIITVISGLKKYDQMAIVNLDIPRDLTTGQSLKFIIELQQIDIDTSVRFQINQQNIFGGVQSQIPESIISDGSQIPYIQKDPKNSLKDQATSKTDIGIQALQDIQNEVLSKVTSGYDYITGTA